MMRFAIAPVQQVRRQVAGVMLLLSIVACSKTGDNASPGAGGPSLPNGKNPTALIESLDSATMMKMEQRTGVWQDADASSEWRAMASGGKIRLIDETMRVGESSTRRVTHYFADDGALVAYYEFRIQTVTASDKSPSKQYVLIKLEFMGDSISRRDKNVDGAAQPVEPFEIETARRHAKTLLAAAKSAPVSSPAKP